MTQLERKLTAVQIGHLGFLILVCISSVCRRSFVSLLDTLFVICMVWNHALSGKIARWLMVTVFGILSLSVCGSILATFVSSPVALDVASND